MNANVIQNNAGLLTKAAFLVIILGILYVVYSYLYPGENASFRRLLKGEANARKPVKLDGTVPAIYTGGDFTLSFWIYIDDFNYLANRSKFLFALSPETVTTTTKSPLVGVLTALQNGMQIRANTVKAADAPIPVASAAAPTSPDITVESNLQALLSQQTSIAMFDGSAPCDVKEVPIQRWVCITIVSSGRVLDIYMDGKLTRSCVLDSVVQVPRGKLTLRLGENGGFGGRYSSVQMWNQQLTPDVIYGIYQMGPTQAQHNLFTDISKYLDLNVTFTGSAPGQPIHSRAPTNPFATVESDVSSAYGTLKTDAISDYSSARSMMSRY